MNDYWLYVSRQEMAVGKTDSKYRDAVCLHTSPYRPDDIGSLTETFIPKSQRLSVWLSGGLCYYASFPRPKWACSASKLRLIAARYFEQATLMDARDCHLTLI